MTNEEWFETYSGTLSYIDLESCSGSGDLRNDHIEVTEQNYEEVLPPEKLIVSRPLKLIFKFLQHSLRWTHKPFFHKASMTVKKFEVKAFSLQFFDKGELYEISMKKIET